ncbi:unnamed protein product [Musa hybrid cultivar]
MSDQELKMTKNKTLDGNFICGKVNRNTKNLIFKPEISPHRSPIIKNPSAKHASGSITYRKREQENGINHEGSRRNHTRAMARPRDETIGGLRWVSRCGAEGDGSGKKRRGK